MLGLFFVLNIMFNHQSCVWISPGFAPLAVSKYPSDLQHIPSFHYKHDPELKSNEIIRYCNNCRTYKPWRAHHCSICKRCVLRMDHHCPWMWNCVGYANYRYFFMFLFYLWAGTLFYIYFGYYRLLQLYRIGRCPYPFVPFFFCAFHRVPRNYDNNNNANNNNANENDTEVFMFTYFLCIGICIVMTGFLAWHAYLLGTNQTTIESINNLSAHVRSYRRFQNLSKKKFLYHLGSISANIQSVFGKQWYLALLPIWTQPLGNGFIYDLHPQVRNVVYLQNETQNDTQNDTQNHKININNDINNNDNEDLTQLQTQIQNENIGHEV